LKACSSSSTPAPFKWPPACGVRRWRFGRWGARSSTRRPQGCSTSRAVCCAMCSRAPAHSDARIMRGNIVRMSIIPHRPGNVNLFFGHNSFAVLSYSSSSHRFHEFQRVLCQPTRATFRLLRRRRRRRIIPNPLANASHSCSFTRHWLHPATTAASCSDDYCDGCDGQHCGRRGRLTRVVNRAAQCGALRVSSHVRWKCSFVRSGLHRQ
jgi:hypothetical protein